MSAFADGKKYQPEPTRIEPAKPPADAAKVHPRVEQFAKLVTEIFEKHYRDCDKKGYGQITEYGKLKAAKKSKGMEILIKLLEAAVKAKLLNAYCEGETWHVYNPNKLDSVTPEFDDIDF
ncbi:MAG: hypothetical protein F6K11_30465 [Leptolyngbya sp. SIO3F4]|nr:hypothetical protein [Leptolyngbya sp. SIO3F4]